MIKNTIKNALIGSLSMLAVAGAADAATVQINPATLAVADGAVFNLTVEGANFAEATSGGGFELTWDTSVLSLTSTVPEIVASLSANGFDGPALLGGVSIDPAGILQVAAGKFFELPVSGTFDIATLTFEALQPGVTTTALGIFALQDVWLGADGITPLANQPDYVGAEVTVNAVPVPSAVWLFGSGLLGMVGVARRR
jgi:hypothetical protein